MHALQKYRVLMMSWVCTIILDPTNGLIEVTKKKKDVVAYHYPKRANTQTKSMLLDENEEIIKKVLDHPKQIYQADVEMAIHILMHSEIPKIKIIKGKAYESLMNFLAVLVHLSPMKLERMHWFDKLKDILTNSKGVMFGIEFQDLVYAHELAVGKLIGAVDFVGCRRSAAYPRGFSCALWHLFHYLTVQASLVKPQTYKPGYVLNIIASFIRYFFPSCPECSRTFQEIAEARKVHEVRDYDEEILWMWEAHNEINRHLAGGLLEDPLFPKKQFPTAKSCPDCKTNHVWDRKKVLNHLKDIYAMEKLSKLNLIHRPPVPPQKEGRKNPPKGDKDHEEDHKEPKEGHNEHDDGNKKHEGSHKNSESGEVSDGSTTSTTAIDEHTEASIHKRSRSRHSHRRSRGKRSADCPFVSNRLYSPLDNIEMLISATYKTILGAPGFAKLVQFMNIFCETCRRYAPTFKKIARTLLKWKPIIRVYAVDCAQDESVEICRDYNITKMPNIRFFPPNFSKERDGFGINIIQTEPNKVIEEVRGHLVKTTYPDGRVNFKPLGPNEKLPELFKPKGNNTIDKVALVVEKKGTWVGKQTILDLLPYPSVGVRIVDVPNILVNFNVDPIKINMVVLDPLGVKRTVSSKDTSAEHVKDISSMLERDGYTPLPTPPTTVAPVENEDYVNKAISERLISGPLKIYRADMEQAIDKLLHIELPKVQVIEGDKLVALKQIIRLLSSLNPLNKNGRNLLLKIDSYVKDATKITGAELAQKIKIFESEGGNSFVARRYVGCLKPAVSAFPCSLWTIFHHLTVEAAKYPKIFAAGSVLRALYGFVKYFFGCATCSTHFVEMAKRRGMELVKTHAEEILWLWAAHNEINKRLAGDPTEDPKFPKIQFPSKKDCPPCRNNRNEFIESEVLKFIITIYDIKQVSGYGVPDTNVYFPNNDSNININNNTNIIIVYPGRQV